MSQRPFPACLVALLLCACVPQAGGEVTARGAGVSAIGQVQGDGARSPREGQAVVVEGVVTGDFRKGLHGYFVQDAGDGDARTSDGIFVLATPGDSEALHAGSRVRIEGRVREVGGHGTANTLTAIEPDRVELLQPGSRDAVAAVALTAPPADWEALEGMRVRIEADLVIDGSSELQRYGQLVASFGGRLWQPTELAAPGSAAIDRVIADNDRRRIVLDDASNRRNPGPAWYLPGDPPRSGSVAREVEAIVDQRHGSWRLQLTAPVSVMPATRPPAPKVAGNLHIAAFNIENYFNGDGRGGDFPTPRGAETQAQWHRQTAKLVASLHALDPDIAALMELENDGYGPQSSIAQLVAALNADGGDWRFIDAGRGPGNDAIRVGLIYRASKVTPQGSPAVLEGGPFAGRSRVPLAQAFKRGDGPTFVVVANHFKSKNCSEATGADADQGDGQGCWNAVRLDSARRLNAWLQSDPTGQGNAPTLVVGDFNAYAMEDPIRSLRDAGWVDAFSVAQVVRPYSFVFDGRSGRLDHALLSPSLAPRLKGAGEWHSNTDEPESVGYAGNDAIDPWRSSDHDPMLLGFDL